MLVPRYFKVSLLNNVVLSGLLIFSLGLHGSQGVPRHTAPPPTSGYWSGAAILIPNTWLYPSYAEKSVTITSPDGRNYITSEGNKITVTIHGQTIPTNFSDRTDVEAGWAPDSSRFFLTWTDGGLVGRWHVQVYEVSGLWLKEIKGIEREPRRDFDKLVRQLPRPAKTLKYPDSVFWESSRYCYSNVVGSQWLKVSSEILISTIVDPEGDCRQGGEFRVYRVAVPSGKILQRYDKEEALRLFGPGNIPKILKD